MCNCSHAKSCTDRSYYCEQHGLYGTKINSKPQRLLACIMDQVEHAWKERLNQASEAAREAKGASFNWR